MGIGFEVGPGALSYLEVRKSPFAIEERQLLAADGSGLVQQYLMYATPIDATNRFI